MERYQVVGFCPVKYTNKDKRLIEGTRLFCKVVDPLPDHLVGDAVDSFYFRSSSVLPDFQVGDLISVLYNRFGSPCGLLNVTLQE